MSVNESNSSNPSLDRRRFLLGSALTFGAAGLAGPVSFMLTKKAAGDEDDDEGRPGRGPRCGVLVDSPFGPIAPVSDGATGLPLIKLPPGFRYLTFSWTGDTMSDGNPVFVGHDGMAVVSAKLTGGGDDEDEEGPRRRLKEAVLIRNHETFTRGGQAKPPINQQGTAPNYDNDGGGGTSVLKFVNGQWVDHFVSLSGTIANCAGGPTPWGTWITCEEEIQLAGQGQNGAFEKDHGFIFESLPAPTTPVPIKEAGMFKHESVVVDPTDGIVYLTEDNSTSLFDGKRGFSAWYRFIPANPLGGPGSLQAGGVLQALQAVDKKTGLPVADLRDPDCFSKYGVRWITVDNPAAPPPGLVFGPSGPTTEAIGKGATRFQRLEGSWYDGKKREIVFCDTEGGPRDMKTQGTGDRDGRGEGAVWRYNPRKETLENVFVSADREFADNPDNLTVDPRGNIFLCEDGSDANEQGLSLLGLNPDGSVFEFARNNIMFSQPDLLAVDGGARFSPQQVLQLVSFDGIQQPNDPTVANYKGAEWAGATFDPSGTWLFVNIQTPGITFAITGPWHRLGRRDDD